MGITIFSHGKIFSHTDKYFLLQINGEKNFFGCGDFHHQHEIPDRRSTIMPYIENLGLWPD